MHWNNNEEATINILADMEYEFRVFGSADRVFPTELEHVVDI